MAYTGEAHDEAVGTQLVLFFGRQAPTSRGDEGGTRIRGIGNVRRGLQMGCEV
jgi:hypothetical protein